jgi:hypothetical protein
MRPLRAHCNALLILVIDCTLEHAQSVQIVYSSLHSALGTVRVWQCQAVEDIEVS